MTYTFGQAKKMLSTAAYLRGPGDDIGEKINSAVSSLAGLSGWQYLRRLVRTFSAGPCFALPQGAAELVRLCVNGSPASLHGQDYQFLHSGPGDLERYIKRGFSRVPDADVMDAGFSATYYPVCGPTFICPATADPENHPQPDVTVTGIDANGRRMKRTIPVVKGSIFEYPAYEAYLQENVFTVVESIVLGDATDRHVVVFGMTPNGVQTILADCHPNVKVPRFRQYRIAGQWKGPFDLLAEVRIDPLPCVEDTDVLQVPSLEPVKFMLLHEVNVAMNEQQAAQGYLQQAVQWLNQMQVTDNTIQTPVVENVLRGMSNGEIAEEYLNL